MRVCDVGSDRSCLRVTYFVLLPLQAEAITLTVAQAFNIAFERWQVSTSGATNTGHA